jgi:hypothetical protein
MEPFRLFHRWLDLMLAYFSRLNSKICFLILLITSMWFAIDIETQWAGVLKKSDVPFMYEASPEVYADYGATVLAWGGTPTPQALEDAKGVMFFGSVGMVTEFAEYYDRFPQTYEQGLCRDIQGNPIKVPWLTDHQHKGIPFWWCCTNQPQFRQYLSERVVETVKKGAAGLHIDDHLGTAGGLFAGACFCDRCVEGFRRYLATLPESEREKVGLHDLSTFDYRTYLLDWLKRQGDRKISIDKRPWYPLWQTYHCREAARFMQELRELAAQTAQYSVPMSANAGLLWPLHLVDYKTLDFFSAEIEHGAAAQRFSDLPLMAYRLADAVGRPLTATASGQDWAYIKEHNLSGLVCGWIAAAYAAGNYVMAPHKQWCYTREKGTHWYAGPKEEFAPLYQFVRQHAQLFDGYETLADLGVILPHRSFLRDRERWFKLCSQLAAANLSYKLLLAGDELVDHPLSRDEIKATGALLLADQKDMTPSDRHILEAEGKMTLLFNSPEEAISAVKPAVCVSSPSSLRVLPRVKQGSAVIHLLNWDYDPARDRVRQVTHVKVIANLKILGLKGNVRCTLFAPGKDSVNLRIDQGAILVPELNQWAILLLEPLQ